MAACGQPRRQRGASYVELLIAATLLATMLMPLLNSMFSAGQAATAQQELAQQHFSMHGLLEELLAQPFGTLDAAAAAAGGPTVASSYSDSAGTPHRRLVYLSRYDGDNADADNDPFTGVDDDLLWLSVTIENTALSVQSLSTR